MKAVIAFAIFALPFAGWSQQPKSDSTTASAKTKAAQPTVDKDALFNGDKGFDPATYTDGYSAISTLGDKSGSIALFVKDGADFRPYGELEIKGQILIGAAGVLAYKDTFQRIKFVKGDGAWKEIGRKAIKNGRLFIETKGDLQVFTIYQISASQYNGIVEAGIHLKP